MFNRKFCSNVYQGIRIDAEFCQATLGFNFRLGEVSPHGSRDIFHFRGANAELQGGVTVLVFGALGNDLAVVDLQNGDRNMTAIVGENARHSKFFCNQTCTHDAIVLPFGLIT